MPNHPSLPPNVNEHGPDDQGVIPVPTPVQYETGQMRFSDGEVVAVLKLRQVTGENITFWNGDALVNLGEELVRIGKACRANIWLG